MNLSLVSDPKVDSLVDPDYSITSADLDSW